MKMGLNELSQLLKMKSDLSNSYNYKFVLTNYQYFKNIRFSHSDIDELSQPTIDCNKYVDKDHPRVEITIKELK